MNGRSKALLVGGPMYDPLYTRLAEFKEIQGLSVETVVAPTHPDLNEQIEAEFASGGASYDLISTHTKYAPSQIQWLTPLDDDLDDEELEPFTPRTLELARIDGSLYSVPRNLDVKLLLYRTDFMEDKPYLWEDLLETATRLRSDNLYGFAFPGKESGLFGHFFELHAMAGGRMFEDEGLSAPRLDDEAGCWALGLLEDLYERAAPPETPDWHYDEVATCFREGRAVMSTDWPGGFYTYLDPDQSAVVNRFDVALYPEGPAGRHIYSSSHTFAIPATVSDRPAAIELLRFLTSRESQAYEASLGTLPARSDSLQDVRSEAGPLAERRWALLERAQKAVLVPPKHANYTAVEDAIWEGIREALLGNKSVKKALEDTEAAARLAAEGAHTGGMMEGRVVDPSSRRTLDGTGLSVSPLCVGCAPLGDMPETFDFSVDEDRARETLRAVFESQINFLDTAASYGDGESERRIGEVLEEMGGLPEDVVLATKADRDLTTGEFSGEQMRRSVERSLRLLGLDRLQLVYLHDPEHESFEHMMSDGGPVEVLSGLKEEGVIQHLGVAGGPIDLMIRFVETDLFEAVITHNRYTLVNRTADPLLEVAAERGVAALNAAPYGSGILAKGPDAYARYEYREAPKEMVEQVRAMRDACREFDVPLAAAALQFSLKDPRIVSTIVGMSRPERVEQTLYLATHPIPAELWQRIDALESSNG